MLIIIIVIVIPRDKANIIGFNILKKIVGKIIIVDN